MVSENTTPQAEDPQAQPQAEPVITDNTPEGQDAFNPALPFVLPTEDNVQAPVAPTEEPATEAHPQEQQQEPEQGAENMQAQPAVPQQEGTQPAVETPLPNMPEQQVPAQPAQPTVDDRMRQMEQSLQGYEAQRAQQVPQPMGVQPTAGNNQAPAEDQIMDNMISDFKSKNPW